ncbi:maleylpyruvate isomerase family mycothiol-dependent enzyme [Compostimonas suwonensis]|nr:maleylpyruvate isomerase family mycothiol-dependent enzyme [Compostimonas suwonensis]
MSSVAIFGRSSDAFLEVVRQIRPEQWDQPGLGEWTVRSLVGHTARAILTVENYLSLDDPGSISVPTAESYYTTVYAEYTDHDSVRERGVEAGIWLGDDAIGAIQGAIGRARGIIDQQHEGRIVSIGGMGIPLEEYLRTRVFELVVHTIDISRATGIPHTIPDVALQSTLALGVGVASATGHAEEILLALTGRGTLPEGFSVV